MQTDERRILRHDGTRNLRDVGGYPTTDGRRTRWRTVYRSDCLDKLDDIGQTSLIKTGLRTIIDLRDRVEVSERPNVFAASAHVAYTRIPFWDEPPPQDLEPDVRRGYRREMDMLGERVARVFGAIAAPGALPVLIHCAAGKDRTGVAIGVLLAAVGVELQAIAEDYALSGVCLGPESIAVARRWVESQGYDWAIWEHLSETPPERMLKTLGYLDEQYGGVERYLVDHGLAAETIPRLRELLTEA